jgi:hypothetical protein
MNYNNNNKNNNKHNSSLPHSVNQYNKTNLRRTIPGEQVVDVLRRAKQEKCEGSR